MKTLTLKPRLSEKSYALSQQKDTYIFDIPEDANRQAVAETVRANFDVKVKAVRIAKTKGKSTRSYRRGGRVVNRGKRPDIRKAYVTLQKGEKLPIYAAVEESKTETEVKK